MLGTAIDDWSASMQASRSSIAAMWAGNWCWRAISSVDGGLQSNGQEMSMRRCWDED